MKLLVAVGLVAAAGPVLSAEEQETGEEFDLELSAGATLSDNSGRTATGRDAETSLEAGLAAGIRQERQRLSTHLSADLRYASYSYGVYGDQLHGGLDAGLAWQIAPWLSWSINDNFGQSLINARDTERPDNTQNVNLLSTGPSMALPLGARTDLLLQGQWSDVSYQESDLGNERLSATVGLRRRLSQRSELSLNGSTERVNYDNLPSSSDFDVRSVFLGWNASGARTTLGLRAGATSVESDAYSSRSPLMSLDVTRRLNTRSSVTLSLGRSFGSAEEALLRDQLLGGISAEERPGIASSGALRADYASVAWSQSGARTSVGVSGNLRRERHKEDFSLNRDAVDGQFDFSRQLRPRLGLNVSVAYYVEDFEASSFGSDEWSTVLGLSWRLASRFSVDADWSHIVGTGDTTLGPDTRDYTENQYSLRFVWSPIR